MGFVEEAEDVANKDTTNESDSDASGGEAERLEVSGDFLDFNFSLDYKIPANEWAVVTRAKVEASGSSNNDHDIRIDGDLVANQGSLGPANAYGWEEYSNNFALSKGSHTLSITVTKRNTDDSIVDLLGVIDTRQFKDVSNFDNTLDTNGYLSDPKLYQGVIEVDLSSLPLDQQAKLVSLNTDFNNTDNGQFVELSNGKTTRTNNGETASITDAFGSEITIILGLDGFGSRTTATPTKRFNGQEVDLAEVDVDLKVLNKSDVGRADYEVVFGGGDVNGLTLKEAGQLNANNDTVTRSIFPTLEPSGEAVIFSEDLSFDLD